MWKPLTNNWNLDIMQFNKSVDGEFPFDYLYREGTAGGSV